MTPVGGQSARGAPNSPAEDHHGAGFLTVGNFLSLLRIPLGFMFLVVSEPRWVAAIVVAGAATDLLDGFIARVTHTESAIGALLDPFCDRIFVFLALGWSSGPVADPTLLAVVATSGRAQARRQVLEPGDLIYVPHEPLVPLATTTDILAVTAAIVGGLAGITSLIITLSR